MAAFLNCGVQVVLADGRGSTCHHETGDNAHNENRKEVFLSNTVNGPTVQPLDPSMSRKAFLSR